MSKIINIEPINQELPSDFADRLGIYYTQQVTTKHKKDNGQFFTPTPIARLLASYCELTKTRIRILDPGCGTAILSCALVEQIVKSQNDIELIDIVAYETDLELIPFSQKALDYLKEWLLTKGVQFRYVLLNSDFVLENSSVLKENKLPSLFEETKKIDKDFDIIISNPPYFKLSKDDKRTIASQELVSGQPNIYSIFMGIAAKLLSENGELIFITPRSFASGNYFKAFRELFFNAVQIEKIHLFDSRKDTFNRDSVLQETVVIKAIREKIDPNKKVLVSSSAGIKDIFGPRSKFGGIIAVEVAKQIETEKVILIASAKTKNEIPFYFRFAGLLGLHKLVPTKLLKSSNFITNWFFGTNSTFDKELLKQILIDTNPIFLKWAIEKVARWTNKTKTKNIIHIHGTSDRILSLKFVNCDLIVKDGGHLMTLNKPNELNNILRHQI